MFLIVFVHLLALISIQDASNDLQRYFDLIDSNRDGKAVTEELHSFIQKFYEEKQEPLRVQNRLLQNVIKRYNRNSTNDYLSVSDLQRLFIDLYSLQNQVPTFLLNGLFEPEQIHLSYTHNLTNEMFISYVTRERPSSDLRPFVQYCEKNCIAIGDTTTYHIDRWHYWIHFIYIRNLEPGMKYNYKLGFIESDNKTIRHIYSNERWTFRTMSPAENQKTEIVYIYGDMGTIIPLGFEVTKSIVEDFNKNPDQSADYIVHVGDIAYAGTGAEMEVQTVWDMFMNQIAPLASQIPYMTATGNHEKYYNYTSYKARFYMPSKTNPNPLEVDDNFYFSLETNHVQWIFLSTEHDYTIGSRQRIFLENLLRQYQEKWQMKARPWLIVVGHRPMYSSDQSTDSGRLQDEIEPLLIEYGVDLAVWGHMHCYERTTPVRSNHFTDREHFSADGKVYHHNATDFNQTSPIHLVIGTAGANIHEQWMPKPEWSQIRYQKYGFGKLFIYNRTHLEFQSILTDKSSSDEEDSFMIIREF